MRHLLNTLYVTTQGAYLCREGETVSVRVERETKLRLPIHTLAGIVCFGQVSCSPPLMQLCGERKVAISFLSEYGKFWARVEGPVSGNVLLRREQYRRADDANSSAAIARSVVVGKVANSRTVLLRALRDHSDTFGKPQLEDTVRHLSRVLDNLREMIPLDSVRGMEGEAARRYFGVFDHLITLQKADFFLQTRTRRPPLDNMNSLLSFCYTLLTHDVASALETVGLDPAVGYLHRDRPGRPGLALDLMEEFRPFLADRLALSLVNLQQVKGKGFRQTETGAILMDDDTRKKVLVAYQKRKQEEIRHPFLDEKVTVGLLPYIQAMLLARYLRGDLDGYPPFVWK
ncbi:MAG: type I-C CRISPR-associated endonuclease Cas1c [Eubacteriales bacterium]|nr:type I-C CRISPR-associated endonuclease Cas1c [Eubacteriales bacterium]MDZ4042769.1 type I-C CRISPR-associated endonuclease Cas1c [Eubacteriales bacterium]MDZ7610067.1 type I-C CRISPR-associated endonuclease Cas1c [Eubacteriales bacterium]